MIATAPAGLDAEQRSKLERLMTRARVVLETDLAEQAEGRFGIHVDGIIEEEDALPDYVGDQIIRRELAEIISHLRSLGEDLPGAIARLLREATFTHLNRLVAIRIAEAIGLLPESLARERQSAGFKDLGEIMPMLAGDYRAYLRLCGDELAADAPALFDPRNPLLALEMSTAAFDEVVALIADETTRDIWRAPDTLGWAYQFFNTGDERRAMREASAPRNSRELAVRNQFFTPRYVVDFLVQNSIGRRLIENDPESPLLAELPYLVNPPTQRGPALDLKDVKCLDPACGSGHFLLGCYDVLESAWEFAGIAPSESAPQIVASLWGVDIDARCAQVASAAIVFRARRHCRDLPLPRPNIVTARGLPGGSAGLSPLHDLAAEQRSLIDRISQVLDSAPLLGTLLKAEAVLDQEIRHGLFEGNEGTLSLTDAAAEATEREVLSHFQGVADQASSSVVERLLAAEADDALRFVNIVRQRYDAVLMNPPFGEPVPETKPYLRGAYPWIPTRDYNLLAAFVGRGLELCKPDGYLGALTGRAGMYLTSSERWRREVLLAHRLVTLADLGYGVMEGAQIEAAAYVLAPSRSVDDSFVAIRLSRDIQRAAALREAIRNVREGNPDDRVFDVALIDLERIPGAPLAYWVDGSIRAMFGRYVPLGDRFPIRIGLQSGRDDRCIRLFWEVDPSKIGFSVNDTSRGKKWVPIAKGGENTSYWADIFLLVDWENDGAVSRSLPESRVQNAGYYFKPGVTWTRRAAALAPRILPEGCIITTEGPGGFEPNHQDAFLLVGWLNLRLTRRLCDLLTSVGEAALAAGGSPKYEVGVVQRLPWPAITEGAGAEVAELVHRIVQLVMADDTGEETSRRFTVPLLLSTSADTIAGRARAAVAARELRHVEVLELSREVEIQFHRRLELSSDAERFIESEAGPHPGQYAPGDVSPADLSELYAAPVSELIDQAIRQHGVVRSLTTRSEVVDRRLELISHVLRVAPSSIARERARLGILAADESSHLSHDLLSYLVGVAFGRWDARIGRDPSLVPAAAGIFDPVSACPPGMLVDQTSRPAVDAPSGYPLALPPSRLLVDEPGHRWDIEAAVVHAAGVFFQDPATILDQLVTSEGRKSLREYLRKQFFKDHLSTYSKSRRKAPIYWPLTVPSQSWGVWVYAPMLSREALYMVAGEAGRRERLAREAIARLLNEQRNGVERRPAPRVAEELDAEERLAEELGRFRAVAERIAGLGWEPDLNDGILLCAAPLADLFSSWPDAKAARTDLGQRKYDWATVAAWADQL